MAEDRRWEGLAQRAARLLRCPVMEDLRNVNPGDMRRLRYIFPNDNQLGIGAVNISETLGHGSALMGIEEEEEEHEHEHEREKANNGHRQQKEQKTKRCFAHGELC